MTEPDTTAHPPAVTPIGPEWDESIAAIIAGARADGSLDRGREIVAAARLAPDSVIRGLVIDDQLTAVYIVQKAGAANELRALAAAPDHAPA